MEVQIHLLLYTLKTKKMKVVDIDFDDPVFKSCFHEYCINSAPLEMFESNSIARRIEGSEYLVSKLRRDSAFSSAAVDENNDYVYFTFSSIEIDKRTNKECLHLLFPFNNNLKKHSPKKICLAAYSIWLNHLELSGLDFYTGHVERIYKNNSYTKWVKRYVKACEFIDDCNLIVKKERIIEEYEKLKI